MSTDPGYAAWLQKARDADILAIGQELANSANIRLRRSGREWQGQCPGCGGDDRFSINPDKRIFNCRKALGGDVITMVMHGRGLDFFAACAWINKEPPPGGQSASPCDPQVSKARKEKTGPERRAREAAQPREDHARTGYAQRIFEAGKPIAGSYGEDYFRNRGINASTAMLADLRFAPALVYRGYADDGADNQVDLGTYPAILAAIRNSSGALVGVHRTYLDPKTPVKLKLPGRNNPKKIAGTMRGGMIRLGPTGRALAIGEGIETTLSFYQLGYGPDDLTVAAAVSLGNMVGSATGSTRHPDDPAQHIPNGTPDMERPGIIIPAHVEELYLIGDGDSDAATTRARILTGARRYQEQGKKVFVCMAPPGKDFNDVLREQGFAACQP